MSSICPSMMCSNKLILKTVTSKTIWITPPTAERAAQDWIGKRKFAKQPWERQLRQRIKANLLQLHPAVWRNGVYIRIRIILCMPMCFRDARQEEKVNVPASVIPGRRTMCNGHKMLTGRMSWRKFWQYFFATLFSASKNCLQHVRAEKKNAKASTVTPSSPGVCFWYKDRAKNWETTACFKFLALGLSSCVTVSRRTSRILTIHAGPPSPGCRIDKF